MKMYEIPEGRRATKGKSIVNFLSIETGEKVTSILAMTKELKKSAVSLIMVTKDGVTKKNVPPKVSMMFAARALSLSSFIQATILFPFHLSEKGMKLLLSQPKASQSNLKNQMLGKWAEARPEFPV
jgi:hypothetical protein